MHVPVTESRSGVSLDRLDPRGLAAAFAAEDARAAAAVAAAAEDVARAIGLARDALAAGGRLVLGGAGTSGRLAVMEAAECRPTFSSDRVVGLIAGGAGALLEAQEGAEDDVAAGAAALVALRPAPQDLVLGIAASGRTPWVQGLLGAARDAGARRGLVACAPPPPGHDLDVLVVLGTGPELLTGSTRLKAATATKCVLNAITTGAMALQGKVMDDLMVDVQATNAKLRARARRIVSLLVPCDEARAGTLLEQGGGQVKVAVVMGRLGLERAEAEARLAAARGHLRQTLAGLQAP